MKNVLLECRTKSRAIKSSVKSINCSPEHTTSILKSVGRYIDIVYIPNRLKSKVVPLYSHLNHVDYVISRSLGISSRETMAKYTAAGTVILSKYVRPPDYARERSLIRIIYSNSMHFACGIVAAFAICTVIIRPLITYIAAFREKFQVSFSPHSQIRGKFS